MTELKPCPFCGGKAELHSHCEYPDMLCVECTICEIQYLKGYIRMGSDPLQFIESLNECIKILETRWNTRYDEKA